MIKNSKFSSEKNPVVIGFSHPPSVSGGGGTFQVQLEDALRKRGWRIVYPRDKITPDIIVLVGGTRRLWWLWQHKWKGVPVIVRLAGLNWLHRIRRVSIKKYIKSVLQNMLLRLIRRFFADVVVYQSEFAANWWRKEDGGPVKHEVVIHNAADLDRFKPDWTDVSSPKSLLCVEGSIDYSPYAIDLINALSGKLSEVPGYKGTLVFGGLQDPASVGKFEPRVEYRGKIEREKMPLVYRNAVYLSLDVNATCPNTVVEALGSGIPVIGFDTGALKELVPPGAGLIVDYGGDPWKGEKPDVPALAEAVRRVLGRWEVYARGAREIAEKKYDFKNMADAYISVIQQAVRVASADHSKK